jgi:redox-sensing transcriptional repressor
VLIHDLRELKAIVRKEQVRIAVLAVPAPAAQAVADAVVAAGIKAILSFSPGAIRVPPGVKLKSVDVTVSLESLSFHLSKDEEGFG